MPEKNIPSYPEDKKKGTVPGPVRVCFIAPKAYALFAPEAREIFGGSEVALYYIAKALAGSPGMSVEFIVADYGQAAEIDIGGVRVIKGFSFTEPFFKRGADFLRAIFASKSDIFVHSALTPYSGLVSAAVRASGRKFIYRVASDYELDGRLENDRGRTGASMSKLVFRLSNVVICQNSLQKRMLEKKGIEPVALSSGVPVEDFNKSGDGSILWVGRSVPTKGHDIFFSLAESMPDRKFVMVSSGRKDDAYHADIRKRAEGIRNLEFVEYIELDKIQALYRAARILVSTSHVEGFPFSFIEAFAAKTPVISLSVDPDNVLGVNRCGMSCGGDTGALADNVIKAFRDEKAYSMMSENAFRYARETHDIKKTAVRVRELLIKMKYGGV